MNIIVTCKRFINHAPPHRQIMDLLYHVIVLLSVYLCPSVLEGSMPAAELHLRQLRSPTCRYYYRSSDKLIWIVDVD